MRTAGTGAPSWLPKYLWDMRSLILLLLIHSASTDRAPRPCARGARTAHSLPRARGLLPRDQERLKRDFMTTPFKSLSQAAPLLHAPRAHPRCPQGHMPLPPLTGVRAQKQEHCPHASPHPQCPDDLLNGARAGGPDRPPSAACSLCAVTLQTLFHVPWAGTQQGGQPTLTLQMKTLKLSEIS